MAETLNESPSGVRTQIGVFGRMNAGKSSLINRLTGQEVSIVSARAGTTTDVVRKSMEIKGLGPCVLLDTAGFDDVSEIGKERVAAARRAAEKTDAALLIFPREGKIQPEKEWLEYFRKAEVPCVAVLSRAELYDEKDNAERVREIEAETGLRPILFSAVTGQGKDDLLRELVSLREHVQRKKILTGLVRRGDVVLLVMPQDPQAPEGRLILPQVQTIREALDRHCLVFCVQTGEIAAAISSLREPPALIVTDSQVFDQVWKITPRGTRLTSFSVLFAALKGDIGQYLEGAEAIGRLTENSRVLIAECCTHAPLEEDIGRVKIPALLRKRIGEGLRVDVVAGNDFPEEAGDYDLIIQCGACMLNRRQVMSRLHRASEAGVPVTNYGITIAWLKNILPHVTVPSDREEEET